MLIWIIILLSVISNAFFLGFRYARRIENKLEVPLQGKRHLYCLGDGITYGVGVLRNRHAYAWPYQLEVSLGAGWQVINYGTEDVTLLESRHSLRAGRAFKALSQVKQPHVLLMIGTNDSRLGIWNERKFEEEFSTFLRQLREQCSELTVLLPISVMPSTLPGKSEIRAETVRQIAGIERDICQSMEVHCLDLFHLTQTHPEWYWDDGVHLNRQGNRAVAEAIFTDMQNSQGIPARTENV